MATEKMENKEVSLAIVLYLLKKYLIIIVLIITLSIGAGYLYARLRVPAYSCSAPIIFKTMDAKDSTKSAINTQFAYADTVVDFCKSGAVLDRANYYYDEFIHGEYQKVEDFVEEKKQAYDSGEDDYSYNPDADYKKVFTVSNVSTSKYDSEKQQSGFIITIKKKAESDKSIDDKDMYSRLQIIILSCDVEARHSFGEGESKIEYVGPYDISSNISVKKTAIVAGGIGVCLAILVVVLLYLLDFTVKDADMLSKLTGTSVLAFVADQEMK